MRPSFLPVAVALLVSAAVTGAGEPAPAPRMVVRPVSTDLRKALKLDPFYEKATDYKGLPILSSAKVSDAALVEARYLISQMLRGRDDLVKAMVKRNCRFVIPNDQGP